MADTPRQVNAAQAARRKILATKPRRVHHDERAESEKLNSVPLFAPIPDINDKGNMFGNGGGGGGLFGGSVQAATTFNFSAPALTQMPSFNFSPSAFSQAPSQATSWGANSTNMSGTGNNMTEDPRADTTGEEAARRNKPFRMMGTSDASPSPSQSFSNPFQPVPQSTLNQAAPLDMAKSNPFQFGATTASSPSPSGSFNFGATPAKSQEQSSTNPFAFGQNQQAPSPSSGFTFGTPPPQEQQSGNIFSFGHNQSQQPASTSTSFGSTPAPTNPFNFGQTQSQQPASTGTNFGSTPAPTNPFNFGQTPSQSQAPVTNSIFSSTPAPAPVQPSTNFFSQPTTRESTPTNIFAPSQPQAAAQTPNIFGQLNSQATPTSTMSSNISTPAPITNGIFGSQNQDTPTASAPSIFGNQTQSTNNLFGGAAGNPFGNLMQPARSASPSSVFDKEAKENTPPTSNIFGIPKPPATSVSTDNTAPGSSIFGTTNPSTSVFGAQQGAAGSSIFENKVDTPPSSNMFGTTKAQSSAPANPFANLNQPAPQAVNGTTHSPAVTSATLDPVPAIEAPPSPRPAPASLQNISPAKPATSFSPFIQGPATNGFSALKQPESILPSVESDDSNRERKETTSPFKSSGQPSTSNLFSSMKPVEAPEDAAQPAPRGMFPSLSQPAQSITNNIFTKPSATGNNIAGPLKATTTGRDVEQMPELTEYFAEVGQVPDSVIESEIPPFFNEEQRLQFFAAYRIRALNKAIKAIVDSAGLDLNYEPVLLHYKTRRDDIKAECETGIRNLKRGRGEADDDDEDVSSPAKRSKTISSSSLGQYPVQSPQKSQPSKNTRTSPEKRSESRANLSPSKSQPFPNGSTTPKAAPPMPQLFPPQNTAPVSPSPKGKRKAEVQITQLDPEGEAAEKRGQKIVKMNGSSSGSETSNIFKNILDKPAEQLAASSPKKVFSLTKVPEEPALPRANPFASLAMPASSVTSTPPVAKPSPFGTDATSAGSSNLFASKADTPSSNMFAKPATAPATTPSNPFASKTGSTPSSMFSQPTSSTPNFFGSKPATAPAVSSPLAKAPTTVDDLPEKSTPATSGNIFQPPMFGSAPTSAPASSSSIKPPTFGAPVNFLAQFGKKADKSAAERERDEMEKAKMEDMDSDEDEAEWEAAYKEKRKASREELKKIARSGKQFSVSDTSGSETEKPRGPAKSIFGQPATTSTPSNSLFPPVPRSGASSPGLMSSNASSVFDGLAPNKPVTFGDNIFGHLSDVDSGADSGKGNDADDDTDESNSGADDEEPEDSEEREELEGPDDERKDATYDPKATEPAAPSTPGTPTTPVEETGAGIASTKKAKVPFPFSTSSNSGTSTPGGSLFDRITRDASGNPVRQVPNEDKENAGPSTSSIFGTSNTASPSIFNFSKSPAPGSTKSPGDNTWKPDTPIKFGASAAPANPFGSSPSTPATPPAVNVQAPTPTKTSPFAGLFGSTNPLKSTTPTTGSGPASPFAGLFGNTSAPKLSSSSIFSNAGNQDSNKPPTVGFNFGGPSTATSSLFPSAAGSGVTSRATTPGGTTDGESANEAHVDDHAAPLEQIDLASGGAGEEDEEKMFEVRTKAQQFEEPKRGGGEKAWVVKGLGSLRILKHKETGKSRILLRADPSGAIVLNKRILPMAYTATQKTVKLLVHDDTGKGMETWLLQVKTPESAKELAEALDKNKASA